MKRKWKKKSVRGFIGIKITELNLVDSVAHTEHDAKEPGKYTNIY